MSDHLGALAAFGTALCWSGTALLFSFSGRRVGAGVVNRNRLLFACLLLGGAHWLTTGRPWPAAEPWRWGWLGASAVLGLVVGDGALFQAFVLVGPRLSMLVMATVPILSALLGWLVMGEALAARELAGMALTVGAVAWVVAERPDDATGPAPRRHGEGIALALLGALGLAASFLASRLGLAGDFPSLTGTLVRALVAFAILWAVALARGQVGHTFRGWADRPALAAMLGGAAIGPFLGVWLSLFAIQHARLGIASTIMALPPVLLIPIERVLFGRRTSARSLAGTVLAVIGVALLVSG